MSNITKVELWLNECYGCKSSRYIPLYDWYLSLKMPLRNFEAIRVPLKKEWQDFAKRMKDEASINIPFVVIRTDGEPEAYIYEYEKFIEEIERSNRVNITREEQDEITRRLLVKESKDDSVKAFELKKKQTKKQSVVKKNKTKTTEVK